VEGESVEFLANWVGENVGELSEECEDGLNMLDVRSVVERGGCKRERVNLGGSERRKSENARFAPVIVAGTISLNTVVATRKHWVNRGSLRRDVSLGEPLTLQRQKRSIKG
jgi:hypothetical protein